MKIRKGIPDCFRGSVWPQLSQIEIFKNQLEFSFEVIKLLHS